MSGQPRYVPLEDVRRRADKFISGDGGPPSLDVERKLNELAEMSPAEYGRRRETLADELGTPRMFLDLEYKERRKRAFKVADHDTFLADPDPWPEPVS